MAKKKVGLVCDGKEWWLLGSEMIELFQQTGKTETFTVNKKKYLPTVIYGLEQRLRNDITAYQSCKVVPRRAAIEQIRGDVIATVQLKGILDPEEYPLLAGIEKVIFSLRCIAPKLHPDELKRIMDWWGL